MEDKEKKRKSLPNILLIVLDDMGYSDLAPYGGEIRTPNISYLAEQGISFSRMHVSSLSAPTRSMLLTGIDNHRNGLGNMPSMHAINQYMQPGYEGYLRKDAVTLQEMLRENGYHTYMAGKWHLGHLEGLRPADRGFEKCFSLIAGGASHFSNAFPLGPKEAIVTFYADNHDIVDQLPDDFYSTSYYTDKMLSYLDEQEDDAPFFAYLAYTAPHDPLHIPDEWKDKYKGMYDGGYGEIARKRLEKYKDQGVIGEKVVEDLLHYFNSEWEKLTADKKLKESRKMEIYAAMIEYADYQIGRVINWLQENNKWDDTICIVMSDNGASSKGPEVYYELSEEEIDKLFNNTLENIGKRDSFTSVEKLWAEVSDAPLAYYKVTTGEGGIQVPMIISGGNIIPRTERVNDLLHVCDIVPTLLEGVGICRPDLWNGMQLAPLYGKSFYSVLQGGKKAIRSGREGFCIEMTESKAVFQAEWKARFLTDIGDNPQWELFNIENDPAEQEDLAATHPDKLQELLAMWEEYAKENGYIQSNGDSALNYMSIERFYEYKPL